MIGALIFLRQAITESAGGGSEPGGFRPIGNVANATHTTLQQGLVALGQFLGGVCEDDELRTGIDPRNPRTDRRARSGATALRALPQLRLGPVPVRLVGPAFSGLGDVVGALSDHLLRDLRGRCSWTSRGGWSASSSPPLPSSPSLPYRCSSSFAIELLGVR
jgi:hypothetical protein